MRISIYQDVWHSNPKHIAQECLASRTHYVDDSTLRFHHSRVLQAEPLAGGLLFGIVESYAVNPDNTARLFRPVIFDLLGTIVYRPALEGGFRSSKLASGDMYEAARSLDAVALNQSGLESYDKSTESEIDAIKKHLSELNHPVPCC